MPRLQLVEESPGRLMFRMSALPMVGQMAMLTFIAIALTISLTLFMRHMIGSFLTLLFVTAPGSMLALSGVWGACNARAFTFTFDRSHGDFKAEAGGAELTVPFNQIVLVYIEREVDAGGSVFSGSSAPSFSVTLLLFNGQRCHLEGGVPVTGAGRGPPELHEHCDKIQEFLRMPRGRVAILELTPGAKPEPENTVEASERMSRWMSCAGIAPHLEPPLYEYVWLEPPEGVILPRPAPRPVELRPIGHPMDGASGSYVITSETRWASSVSHGRAPLRRVAPSAPSGNGSVVMGSAPSGNGSVVMGRVVGQAEPQPRFMTVTVPDGMTGQSMTVMTPDGLQLAVTVPNHVPAGEQITLQY